MVGRGGTTLRALCISIMLMAGLGVAHASPTPQPIDEVLKQRLIRAMTENNSFTDRYEAEVWLVDMADRLSTHIPNQQKRLELLKLIHYEAKRTELDPELVLAVIEVESRFDRFAISNAGAQGLMQIMPFWLKELDRPEDNLFNVQTNLRMGCTILRYYIDMENGDVTRALARYNGSTGSNRYPNKVYASLRNRWAYR